MAGYIELVPVPIGEPWLVVLGSLTLVLVGCWGAGLIVGAVGRMVKVVWTRLF